MKWSISIITVLQGAHDVKNSTVLVYNRINKSGSTSMTSRISNERNNCHLIQIEAKIASIGGSNFLHCLPCCCFSCYCHGCHFFYCCWPLYHRFCCNVFVSLLFLLSMSGLGCLQVFKIDFQDCFWVCQRWTGSCFWPGSDPLSVETMHWLGSRSSSPSTPPT